MTTRTVLKKAREAAGLTQAELAEIAGIERSSYAHIELGDRDPTYRVAYRIANRLGLPMENLFEPVKGRQQQSKEASADDR